MRDFVSGFQVLHFVGACMMTGGGPGIMEATNRGGKDVGGRSVGCYIELPREQHANAYLDRFVRKTLLLKYSGTIDEMFKAKPSFRAAGSRASPL